MNASSDIIFILVAVYTIYRGITILTTGKLQVREEERIKQFSEKGIRRYKLLSAAMNIVCGLILIAAIAAKMLNLVDRSAYRYILLAALVVMIAAYVILWNSCKKC